MYRYHQPYLKMYRYHQPHLEMYRYHQPHLEMYRYHQPHLEMYRYHQSYLEMYRYHQPHLEMYRYHQHVLIPPASSGDVPLPKASSGNVPIPPASFGDEQDEDYCQESDFDSDSTPSSCDYPILSPPAQRKKTCQGMVTTRQQSLVFSMAGWHPVALAPQAMMLPAQSVSRLTFPNNVQLPTDLTVLQQQLRTTGMLFFSVWHHRI
ncbi:uncharacterized protein [Littorina saxatilis]|uniref:uncharacterized protein isoform X2 n=1 Tax=Littorina saxatilis TaxID=31220 RepID=UPI0038B4B7D9